MSTPDDLESLQRCAAIAREMRKLAESDRSNADIAERLTELSKELNQALGIDQAEEDRLDAQARAEEMMDEEER